MENVTNFIRWACSHAKPLSGASVPFPVGTDGIWCYLWGTKGQVVTQSLLDARYRSYYGPHDWSRDEYNRTTAGWVSNKKHVTDCQGLLDCYLKNDTTANGNYKNYCTQKGLIKDIDRPWVIGEAVFNGTDAKKTHVGWIVSTEGDPCVVEARGLAYGVVITRLSKRPWKYRGLMTKRFSYDPAPEPPTPPTPPEPGTYVFTRPLKYGVKGDDVIELKKLLISHGYDDGITVDTPSSVNFGGKTRAAVKAFQKANKLSVDGIAGRNTITALGGIYE
jgi:hypothetical protein